MNNRMIFKIKGRVEAWTHVLKAEEKVILCLITYSINFNIKLPINTEKREKKEKKNPPKKKSIGTIKGR